MSVPPTSPASPTHRVKSRMTRRTVIGAAGAVAAGAVITPTVMATTGDSGAADATDSGTADTKAGTTTETFPKTRSEAATGEAPVEAAFPIGYIGVRWGGTDETTGGGIRLTDADGARGDWKSLGDGGCSVANGGGALIAAGGAAGYELKAPEGATGLRSLAVDCAHGPDRKVRVPSDPTRVRGVQFLTRAAWGADESLRFKPDGSENSPTAFYPFQTITVHHTAMANDDPDPAATVRAIYQLHAVTNDWGDIGYHFLIDEAGRIYEGRYSGDDGLPAHDADGKVVTAFHVGGFNSGNLGIALLGTFTEQGPKEAARTALTRLVKVLVRQHGVDPQARVTYTNPVNGTKKEVAEISGHRDWMATECPGEVMYGELERLRTAVATGR
ncbi:peptidoglycan recognition protein family protein [Streptomyces griseiscabiei]|uniref:Peptidoglycan recognition protein family protein n=1 Tax=Streptomyces griseiscabiei TaxID=2993540 RepID=A0ABU4LGH1_9ACTN|nr:peptidoglycan recognition family protein [Streptomyces griseiscabiei]MDX2914792.1 peptidoglycan recognition protein family protein [Streptomyces griseiscabiei]